MVRLDVLADILTTPVTRYRQDATTEACERLFALHVPARATAVPTPRPLRP